MFHSALPSLASLVWLAVVVWLIADCIRSRNNIFWIFTILFFPPFGAIIYVVVNKLPEWNLDRRWDVLWSGQRRIQELKAQIQNMDRPYHWARLGDEYRSRRNWSDAARCYREALQRDSAADDAEYGLGVALLGMSRPDEALSHLEKIAAQQPDYDYGQAMMAVARARRALGQTDGALGAYEAVLRNHTYSETSYEYADLLWQAGRREEAVVIMNRIDADARVATGFNRAQERMWGRRARRFLATHI